MADNKKYYYMRLKENFFDSDEMIVLENMDNGDGIIYSNILLKLYLRSLKYEGRLMFNERIPFNAQMLSTIVRHPVGIVEKALKVFVELNLVEVMDNGAIYMLDIQNFIGKTSTEADRKKIYRAQIAKEKGLLIEDGQMSGQMSDKRTPELELEIKKEKELDLDLEKDKDSSTFPPENKLKNITKFFESEFGRLSPVQLDELRSWVFEDNFDVEVIKLAVKEASLNNKRTLNYIKGILRNWRSEGIETVSAVNNRVAERFESKQPKEWTGAEIPLDGPCNK